MRSMRNKNKNNMSLIRQRVEFYTKKKVRGELLDYAALLVEKLERLKGRISKKNICPAEFIRKMDKICAEIREKLAEFYSGYHRSFPWYVSREAFSFAFELPTTFRMIEVRRDDNHYRLRKSRVSRKQSRPPDFRYEDEGIFSRDMNDEKSAKELIAFCANIEHFIFYCDYAADVFPFSIDAAFRLQAEKEEEELTQSKVSEYLVWYQNTKTPGYRGALDVIRERLREYNSAPGK